MENETLDQIIDRCQLECEIDRLIKKYTSASDSEQFTMTVEKYQRYTIDDDER